jgi:hypothetical protein
MAQAIEQSPEFKLQFHKKKKKEREKEKKRKKELTGGKNGQSREDFFGS